MINEKKISTTKTTPSVTFQVQELTPPEKHLEEYSLVEILKSFTPKVEAHYQKDKQTSLVYNGHHAFINTVYQAYAEHRPLVLSPDMIWLLIVQGFANHVNFHAGTEKDIFFYLKKEKLVVRNDALRIGDSQSPWDQVPTQFVEAISKHLDPDLDSNLLETLKADFSTTTTTERIVSQITVMDAMKSYFEYIVFAVVCGIPSITLEGKPADWERISDKLNGIKGYGIDWWLDQLNPILQEFVAASKGDINPEFWKNIFKENGGGGCGPPLCVDGWILDFYPYDRNGRKQGIKEIRSSSIEKFINHLPKEIKVVPFEFQYRDNAGRIIEKFPMEYWAGFIGLQQNKENFALRPEIGWFVAHAPQPEKKGFRKGKVFEAQCFYNLEKIPKDVYKAKGFFNLSLNFKGQVKLSTRLFFLKCHTLEINGVISTKQKLLLRCLFFGRRMSIFVNGKLIKYGWF